jgi:uncharacterized protein (DUF1501 family)
VTKQGWISTLHPDCPDVRRLADNPGEAILRAEAEAVAAENASLRSEFLELNNVEEQQQDGRGVTRRRFLVGTAATATALATTQFLSTQVSFAATPTGTLIHVFLFGGMDGLSLVAPSDDALLRANRPQLVLHLDAGRLAFIPGVSDPRLSRSHFQATDACNLGGLPAETGGRGFLDTLADSLGTGTSFRSVGIGSTLPRSLVGTNNALALNSVSSLNLNGDNKFKQATADAIRGLFTGINHPVEDAVKGGLDALALAQQISAKPYTPAAGVTYTGVGNAFQELAKLIKGGANVRIATVGMGGYDTHEDQGTNNNGYLFRRLKELADAMNAFFTDLGPASENVTIMVSSEFGRRVAQNGTGTDHGHGGVVTILSGKPLKSSVLGAWGGLGNLDNGDVPEFNNLFDVFGSVMKGRFGLTNAEVTKVFPRRTFTDLDLFA